jgi:NAD-dependent SIR2 family protein deacetylase
MSITSGTKLPDGTVVLQGEPMHMNKMRCMKCYGEARQVTNAQGKKVFKCDGCGREWLATTF